MKAIAAMSKNRCVGKNKGLPWPSIKNDFIWFKEFTLGKTLILGKNTFDTLPKLKDRECMVIVKPQPSLEMIKNQHLVNQNGMTGKLVTFNEVLSYINHDNFIIAGGAKTYELFLPHIAEFYVTHINGDYDGDAYMPAFEHLYNRFELIKEFDGHKVIKYSR